MKRSAPDVDERDNRLTPSGMGFVDGHDYLSSTHQVDGWTDVVDAKSYIVGYPLGFPGPVDYCTACERFEAVFPQGEAEHFRNLRLQGQLAPKWQAATAVRQPQLGAKGLGEADSAETELHPPASASDTVRSSLGDELCAGVDDGPEGPLPSAPAAITLSGGDLVFAGLQAHAKLDDAGYLWIQKKKDAIPVQIYDSNNVAWVTYCRSQQEVADIKLRQPFGFAVKARQRQTTPEQAKAPGEGDPAAEPVADGRAAAAACDMAAVAETSGKYCTVLLRVFKGVFCAVVVAPSCAVAAAWWLHLYVML